MGQSAYSILTLGQSALLLSRAARGGYRAARDRLHERSIVLIGETARDHGGKARLVLPLALDDGFQVLLWGNLTLLGRSPLATVRSLLPRVGPPVPSDALLDDAIGLHRDGFTWEAEQIYRHILWQWPDDHTSALHLLGVVLHQIGNDDEALRLIGRAIALDPSKGEFFNNFGPLLAQGRHVEGDGMFLPGAPVAAGLHRRQFQFGLRPGKT